MSYKKILLLLIVHCALCIMHLEVAYCQTNSYQYGFEEGDVDSLNWVLNAGERGEFCNDRWMIGNVEHSEGYQSLYISCDSGRTSNYGVKPNVVVAYRILELEDGHYDVSFDWKVWGEENVSELYVCALPDNYKVDDEGLLSNDTIGYFHKGFSRFIQPVVTDKGERMALSGSTVWSNASFVISVAGARKVQLAFVWVNANQDSTLASPMGACIDNIQITSAMCPKPENIVSKSECGVLNIQWDGTAPEYECGYKRVGSKYWNNEYGVNGEVEQPSFAWTDVEEGAYDVRVRAIADKDTSAYVYLNTVVVWCPDNHCFDFVSLNNDNVVTCEAGAAIMYPLEDTTEYSFAKVAPIDFGSNSIFSRHTTNWVQGEMDPRTGNRLRTIPEGELASVRLGNWNSGAQAERITYNFDVVGDLVLLMKYAVVLENPGHGEYFDPYFGLEILKEDGTPISKNATCGEAFFSPQKDPEDWQYSGAFVWKDWTTIGIDLRECKGQKIKIQLTTQDCTPGAHGGYAYFTLDCIDATIKSDGCENIKLEAPSGFRYSWYNKTNKEFVPTTSQTIFVSAGDTTTYYCDVSYLDNANCSFTLSSAVIPHNPKADFDWNWTPEKCNNTLKFVNTSKVFANINGVDSLLEGERCEHYVWEFNFNGEITTTDLVNPRYVMPNEGGKLGVSLSAYLEDEKCVDVFDTIITIDSIYPHDIKIDEELCWGDYIVFGSELIAESGTWIDTFPNVWGCDSVVTMNVVVREPIEDVVVYDTVCSLEPYHIGDYMFDSTGVYEVLLTTDLGCDSVVILHLEKMAPLAAEIDDIYRWVCADDSLFLVEYELVKGARGFENAECTLKCQNPKVDDKQVEVRVSDSCFEIVMPYNLRPDSYTAEIVLLDTVKTCGNVVLEVVFDVYYSSSLMEPKFGHMITVLDSAHNGGYVFDEYRWYRDGDLMDGETQPFLYLDGVMFDGECYYLEVKRKDDGVVMRSCEVCPDAVTAVDGVLIGELIVEPTVVDVGGLIKVNNQQSLIKGQSVVRILDLQGRVVMMDCVELEDMIEVNAPIVSGVYLLQIITDGDTFVEKILVK